MTTGRIYVNVYQIVISLPTCTCTGTVDMHDESVPVDLQQCARWKHLLKAPVESYTCRSTNLGYYRHSAIYKVHPLARHCNELKGAYSSTVCTSFHRSAIRGHIRVAHYSGRPASAFSHFIFRFVWPKVPNCTIELTHYVPVQRNSR